MSLLNLRFDRQKLGNKIVQVSSLALLALGLQNSANAETPDGFVKASDLSGIASVELLPSGDAQLVFLDGRTLTVDAENVKSEDGILFVNIEAIENEGLMGQIPLGARILGGIIGAGTLVTFADGEGEGSSGAPNSAPTISSAGSATIIENATTPALDVQASDAEGDTLSFSISGGVDAALFDIDTASGALSFRQPPDFETAQDGNQDNDYEVIVSVSDGANTITQTIVITVENANDNAPEITSSNSESVDENTVSTGYSVTATDADGDDVTFSIVGGADAALFTINPETGAIEFLGAQDFEAFGDSDQNGTYELIVQASDGVNEATQTVTFTLQNLNDNSPSVSGVAFTVDENGGSSVGPIQAIDADGNPLSFSISGGDDGSLFAINASTGLLSFATSPDFESPSDDDADNVYEIIVSVSDGQNVSTGSVTVTVNDLNEAPEFLSAESVQTDENTNSIVYTAQAQDPEGGSITYSISGGDDAARFNIDSTSGEVRFITAPDFEAPNDSDTDNIYEIEITASEGTTSSRQTVEIEVTNLNDNAPSFSSSSAGSFVENILNDIVFDVDAIDADGDAVTYALSGADSSSFAIDSSTGEISTVSALDFENPSDVDQSNTYELLVTASDGNGQVSQQAVTLSVSNENDNDPVLTNSSSATVSENISAVVLSANATDADGDPITYSIIGGDDANAFTIDTTNGALTFTTPPDFEAPTDSDSNNSYDVTIAASDGIRSVTQTLSIEVVNQNDNAPVFSGATSIDVAENTTAVGAVSATDVDGDPVTYAIVGGTDQSLFTINANTGALTFTAAPDFEGPTDQNTDNQYELIIRASDGSNTTDQAVSVVVENLNDTAPVITTMTTNASFSENTSGLLGPVLATDADGSSLTWAISGQDASAFTIDSTTGDISFAAPLDFENPSDTNTDNEYTFDVTVNDGIQSDSITLNITITNVNDVAPNWQSASNAVTPENILTTGYTALAVDTVEGDPVTYSIAGGDDAALFAIGSNTGVVSFVSAPDFENPADANSDNEYLLTIRANDGANDADLSISISVSDIVNEQAPVFTIGPSITFTENVFGAGFSAIATDPQNDPVTYSITGGADASQFSINTTTGQVSLIPFPDFENPADANLDNIYMVEVTATDGTNATAQLFQFSITNLNDNVAIISSGFSATTAENNSSVVYTAVAADADGDPLSYTISGGADASLFTIDASTGEISFVAAPDFETPLDADTDNVYEVEFEVSDGTNSASRTVDITVTNVNDESPTITSPSSVVFDENDTSTILTATAVDPDGAIFNWSITGGADSSAFSIDMFTGALSFVSPRNFEIPSDSNNDNDFEVAITVTDGNFTDTQLVIVTLDDVNESPIFQLGPLITITRPENTAPNDGFLGNAFFDPEFDPLVLTLSGPDASLFTLNANNLYQLVPSALDFENPTDANNDGVYELIVTASDGSLTASGPVNYIVLDANEAPEITSPSTILASENFLTVFTLTASDPDAGAPNPTWSITGGVDANAFTIDQNTGELRFVSNPDFEAPLDLNADNVYEVEVAASDGSLSGTQTLSVEVTNSNDNLPTISYNTAFVIPENSTTIVNQTLNSGSDLDGDPLTYSISGADAGLFTIDSATGEIFTAFAPNFEAPNDANTDGVYEMTISVTDGFNTASTFLQGVIQNVIEAPVFSSGTSGSIDENSTAIAYNASAASEDGYGITYAISGGTDASLFTINSSTGEVTPVSALDFENPTDANQNNVYEIEVQATGGTSLTTTTQAVSITVNDLNDTNLKVQPSLVDLSDPEIVLFDTIKLGEDDGFPFGTNRPEYLFGEDDLSDSPILDILDEFSMI